ncbi:MAG TPA: CHAT domain-containing protein [Polyangiaceae bacterium]|nr:CHAT domain-containing protein [Polyangiaceae bacterium]
MAKNDDGRALSRDVDPFGPRPLAAEAEDDEEGGSDPFTPPCTPPRPRRREGVKLLFLSANAAPSRRVGVDREYKLIERKVRSSPSRQLVELVSAWAVTFEDLQRCLLEHEPDIVHFAGHGNASSELMLLDETGQPAPLPPDALASLFQVLGHDVSLVVLNACFSKAQAASVCESVGLAIGMSNAVDDGAAIAFSGAFYEALVYGRSVRDAFALGVTAIKAKKAPQQRVPRLLARADADPDRRLLPKPSFFSSFKNGSLRRHLANTFRRRRTIEIAFRISLCLLVAAPAWQSYHCFVARQLGAPSATMSLPPGPAVSIDGKALVPDVRRALGPLTPIPRGLEAVASARLSAPAMSAPTVASAPRDAGFSPQGFDVALTLSPPDAHVFLQGVDLGTMPISVPVPAGGTVEVEIKRDGFWAQTIELDGSQPTRAIRLVPYSNAGASARPPQVADGLTKGGARGQPLAEPARDPNLPDSQPPNARGRSDFEEGPPTSPRPN